MWTKGHNKELINCGMVREVSRVSLGTNYEKLQVPWKETLREQLAPSKCHTKPLYHQKTFNSMPKQLVLLNDVLKKG